MNRNVKFAEIKYYKQIWDHGIKSAMHTEYKTGRELIFMQNLSVSRFFSNLFKSKLSIIQKFQLLP